MILIAWKLGNTILCCETDALGSFLRTWFLYYVNELSICRTRAIDSIVWEFHIEWKGNYYMWILEKFLNYFVLNIGFFLIVGKFDFIIIIKIIIIENCNYIIM